MSYTKKIVFAVFAIACVTIAHAQSSRPAFEVASVKPNNAEPNFVVMGVEGNRFTAKSVTVRMLLQFAHQPPVGSPLLNDRIIGGPGWIGTDRFDVDGKPGDDAQPFSRDQAKLMVQSLLADRFQLHSHWEERELPVYNLVVAKGGLKVKLSEDQTPPDASGLRATASDTSLPPRGITRVTLAPATKLFTLMATAIPLSKMTIYLPSYVGRAVIDKSGVAGLFDVRLEFSPETLSVGAAAPSPGGQAAPLVSPDDPSGLSIFAAIQEQLGLKLESGRGPVEVLVIDSVSKPSEN